MYACTYNIKVDIALCDIILNKTVIRFENGSLKCSTPFITRLTWSFYVAIEFFLMDIHILCDARCFRIHYKRIQTIHTYTTHISNCESWTEKLVSQFILIFHMYKIQLFGISFYVMIMVIVCTMVTMVMLTVVPHREPCHASDI